MTLYYWSRRFHEQQLAVNPYRRTDRDVLFAYAVGYVLYFAAMGAACLK